MGGNFAAHIDEGIVLVVLALWWMYNIYKNYIQSLHENLPYRSHCSYYFMFKGRRLPLELMLKILFPVAGKNGNYQHIDKLVHISIFALFILHGVSDSLEYSKLPSIKGMKYFTFATAFIWYGVGFYFHSMPDIGRPPLENILHRFLIPLLLISGLAMLFEYGFRNNILPQIVRCFSVLCAGEWIILTSFLLFLPTPFPGSRRNPAWNEYEISNVRFMEVAIAFLLAANITFMIVSYTMMALYLKYAREWCQKRDRIKYTYAPLTDFDES
ncbi:uncharacterized protein LOC123523409 [Mercenaria mercenaria]|uniref:uncharacterized protein LOC123523409 n=1 Tax=Mercenaria mercenaria TaxID=6596 RepID=UPI00234F97B9|nr:uncharacterized protein LOC123523409 [Mercenaria mercenaria]